jgi:hypothetical protein
VSDIIIRELQRLIEREPVVKARFDRLAAPKHLVAMRVSVRRVVAQDRDALLADRRLVLNHEPLNPPGLESDAHPPPLQGGFIERILVIDVGGSASRHGG